MSETFDIQQLAYIFSNHFEYLRNEEMSATEIRKFYESKIPSSYKQHLSKILDIFVQRFDELQSTEVNSYEEKEIFFTTFELIGDNGDVIVSAPQIIESTNSLAGSTKSNATNGSTTNTNNVIDMLKKQKPLQNTFLISIDGSVTSDYAFESALRLKSPTDKIVFISYLFCFRNTKLAIKIST